eukprot:1700723-Amphidinium_carterae.2
MEQFPAALHKHQCDTQSLAYLVANPPQGIARHLVQLQWPCENTYTESDSSSRLSGLGTVTFPTRALARLAFGRKKSFGKPQ